MSSDAIRRLTGSAHAAAALSLRRPQPLPAVAKPLLKFSSAAPVKSFVLIASSE